jgi:hypothetical protein
MASAKKRTATKRVPDIEVPIRVTVADAPGGVQFSLGRTDDGEKHEAKVGRGRDLSFDLTLRARLGEKFSILGEHAHGPVTARFIPIGVGTLAGQADSCWTRVIKVHLSSITPKLVRDVQRAKGARLQARVNGVGRNGTPACATVQLLGAGWSVSK